MNVLTKLSPSHHLSENYSNYLELLKNSAYLGDIELSYSSRLAVATDNSIYQQLPQAVLHPKSTQDLCLIAKLAENNPSIQFSARGGGTGTNGQSLTPGIIVDTSRHMNAIIELNIEEQWVRVQSGVVKDALNDFLRPHGFFFSPDLSTSNRATIGGMISTDASGQGSLVYGKTSDHLISLDAVLANGNLLHAEALPINEAKELAEGDNWQAILYKQAMASCVGNRAQILAKFPRLNRFLTGYDLEHTYNDKQETIHLGRLIAGAEGSLGFISEAKLNITQIPRFTTLVNIKYNNFESALRHAPSMIAANATSVETVDSKVLNLARKDIVWHTVSDLISDIPNAIMDGLNMVEYNSEDAKEIEQKIAVLCKRLDKEIANDNQNGVIGYQLTTERKAINRIYGMRKKAVGLLGKTEGKQKPIAFTEDTAVPPENLADFIMEFRALLDNYGLNYGMFGHVDAGVLHVRPALDLCDPVQEELVNKISDQVVALVSKYGGIMWGEHGKGYRSQYAPEFFGEHLYDELCKIKAAFDPMNKMNPGKICTPYGSNHKLVQVSDTKRASFDREIPISFKEEFEPAMSCNGNGLCFNYDTRSPMCPSSKITRDRRHSPKGRATLIREWLFQLQSENIDAKNVSPASFSSSLWSRFKNSINSHSNDFNHEVLEAMDGCLACKSCASQCPVSVDVPDFRAKFLAIYYTRYLRPIKDYFVAEVERLAPLMAKAPRLCNALTQSAPSAWFLKTFIGYVDTPAHSVPVLNERVKDNALVIHRKSDLNQLSNLSNEQRVKHVLIVQDPFTSYYDADVVENLVRFIDKLGLIPVLLPFSPNGKPQHVKGFLQKFEKTATQTSQFLTEIAQLNIPMIGADASLVLCYRDEYRKTLGEQKTQFTVNTITEWLNEHAADFSDRLNANIKSEICYKLLAHCSEKTALPDTEKTWQRVFQKLGLELEIIAVGCCGMAGTYGHELAHYHNSKGIYDLSWAQHAKIVENEQMLVTGYSCRSQVKRFANFRPKHPIEVLVDLI